MATIKFKAEPYEINGWLVLLLPDEASQQLPSRGQVMVKGTINGFAFQTALEPDGDSGHWLNIDKAMQQAAHVNAGDTVALEIESTKDWPEPTIPNDWQAALDGDQQVYELWSRVTPMARWEWLRWINATANPATRQKRIEVSCSKLLKGMRRPCCFNRNMCCVPQVSKSGILIKESVPV